MQRHWKGDNLWLRVYVLLAWSLDTVQEILLLRGIYVYLVTDIGNTAALGAQNVLVLNHYFVVESFLTIILFSSWLGYTPLIGGIVNFQVQLLFVYRSWTRKQATKAPKTQHSFPFLFSERQELPASRDPLLAYRRRVCRLRDLFRPALSH